jgi:hypothetical protein
MINEKAIAASNPRKIETNIAPREIGKAKRRT